MRNSWGDKINRHTHTRTHTAETLSRSVWWQAVMALYSSRWSLQSLLPRSPQWLLSSNMHTHTYACMHKTFTESSRQLKISTTFAIEEKADQSTSTHNQHAYTSIPPWYCLIKLEVWGNFPFCTCKDSKLTINWFNTCWVMANPMTGSPSRMSHVTIAEFPSSALMVTLSGADKLSEDEKKTKR